MTNGDPDIWIFLSHPQTNNAFFFILTVAFLLWNNLPEVPQKAEMQSYMMTSLGYNNNIT